MTPAILMDGKVVRLFGDKLLNKILFLTSPSTVVDVGVGEGVSARIFSKSGYDVTGVSLSDSGSDYYTHIKQRFEDTNLKADIVWCAHILEHVPNVGAFLTKCKDTLNDDGWLCIIVPSDPTDLLIDGHLTFWTPAHLIYNLVLAGFDCSKARYYTRGRDIALMVKKVERPEIKLNYDKGDYELLKSYFPIEMIPRKTNPWLEDNFEDSNISKGKYAFKV